MFTIISNGIELQYGNEGYIAENIDQVLEILKDKGVAVLPNVLNEAECQAMNDGMWDTAEYLTSGLRIPVKRNEPDTYNSLFDLNLNHGGLIQHHQWGHAQYVWDVRQNPKVAEVYNKLYGDDLLVSFDGVNVSLGNVMSGRKRGFFRGKSWLHTDQRPSDSTFKCVQSWVTANDINVGDATLRFLSGSHKLHEELAEEFNLKNIKEDWFIYTPEHLEWFKERGCVDTCITCPAGSQVFWDSRTTHSGIEFIPQKDFPERKTPKIHRNVVYICFDKKKNTTLNKRAKIMDPGNSWRLRMASHWPNHMKLFGRYPRNYGNKPPEGCTQTDTNIHWSFVPELPMPELNDYGKKIALGI